VLREFSAAARPHVNVVDRVPEERVIDEYRRHDVLVFPSTYEGFGLVVLEALSQSLPVIACPVGCAPELVRDGQTGVIVGARDSRALGAAVTRLMNSPAERVRLGANGAASVSAMSWARTAERTIAVYARALASRAAAVRS
jgi:glycosyltransferase involved in cell wall biosynthesis